MALTRNECSKQMFLHLDGLSISDWLRPRRRKHGQLSQAGNISLSAPRCYEGFGVGRVFAVVVTAVISQKAYKPPYDMSKISHQHSGLEVV